MPRTVCAVVFFLWNSWLFCINCGDPVASTNLINITWRNKAKIKRLLKARIAYQESRIAACNQRIDRYARAIAFINAGGKELDAELYFNVKE